MIWQFDFLKTSKDVEALASTTCMNGFLTGVYSGILYVEAGASTSFKFARYFRLYLALWAEMVLSIFLISP